MILRKDTNQFFKFFLNFLIFSLKIFPLFKTIFKRLILLFKSLQVLTIYFLSALFISLSSKQYKFIQLYLSLNYVLGKYCSDFVLKLF